MTVHNHDLDPTCAESVVDGKLVGECIKPATSELDKVMIFRPNTTGADSE